MTRQTPTIDLSFDALRAAYREQRLTPRALMLQLRARAQSLSGYNVYIHPLDAAELEPYLLALEQRQPDELPLYGLPFAIKDNIDLAGIPTTVACPAYAYTPSQSATVVARLIELGALPTGKTNLDQFATGLNGQRSPYGGCRNSRVAEYPSGGSSSGSALAVALGLASFALGTDTAGSGRIPAALNHLAGTKPTRGIVSTHGVVPACRSLDCIAFLTRQPREAGELLALTARIDQADAYSRRNPAWNAARHAGAAGSFRFGIPAAPEWLDCREAPRLFASARAALESLGGVAVEIDFAPFMAAARLLYEGPYAAERYAAFGDMIERDPQAVLPVIRQIVAPSRDTSAATLFQSQHRLQALKAECDRAIDGLDFVMTPTYARAPTIAELQAEPVLRNSELGLYTNFMNLLDYAAVATPAGFLANGLPWGVTLFGRAFTDQYLIGSAQSLSDALFATAAASPIATIASDRARVVVCGAHLQGLPLNHQLLTRGARLIEKTLSAPNYRLYALAGGPIKRPAMLRSDTGGAAIEVEVWELPSAELGSFLTGIPAPLGLGKLQLADGSWETGFICESSGLAGAEDITAFGGWRAWLSARI
ncbi:MAG: atzF [Hydrocarboniphaga sp.]|uniref:allophanate hydrolase n=1 Tax=Hydrocarboniphaga sp. TaxID=2033016 RepID=UPI002630F28C|nr:allophanate hydrolase [Hydrocarboniphaga sp.]MDB5970884.1 atzF [Hydrocarboniphaga sp.]